MSEAEKYKGLDWIKRATPIEMNSYLYEGTYIEEKEYQKETSFLIDKVRELAEKVDILNANLRIYTHAVKSQRNQYYDERDYLPYEEDDRR